MERLVVEAPAIVTTPVKVGEAESATLPVPVKLYSDDVATAVGAAVALVLFASTVFAPMVCAMTLPAPSVPSTSALVVADKFRSFERLSVPAQQVVQVKRVEVAFVTERRPALEIVPSGAPVLENHC